MESDRVWLRIGVVVTTLCMVSAFYSNYQAHEAANPKKSEGTASIGVSPVLSYGAPLLAGVCVLLSSVLLARKPRYSELRVAPIPEPIKLGTISSYHERAPADTQWNFKSKLRVAFANESGFYLEVFAPEWVAGIDDVPIQKQQSFCSLQSEGVGGWKSDSWEPEAARIRVAPNGIFRLWVGLDQTFTDDDVHTRIINGRLGTLCLPVKVNGQISEIQRRF